MTLICSDCSHENPSDAEILPKMRATAHAQLCGLRNVKYARGFILPTLRNQAGCNLDNEQRIVAQVAARDGSP